MNIQSPAAMDSTSQSRAPDITVRQALYEEAEEIVRLYVENLGPIAHMPIDMKTVCIEIYNSINEGRTLVAERDGRIIGCASYRFSKYWYASQLMLFDTGFFIIPEFRKTRAAYRLFRALKKEALDRKTILIMTAGTKDKSVAPIMAKRYPMVGVSFAVGN